MLSGDLLVVDDNVNNLTLLAEILRDAGHRVRTAPSGPRALTIIGARAPELVLLDIRMPAMDGYEVCQKLKANPATRDIPVLFISASDDVGDIVKAFEAGGVDYVTKPFRSEEVLARVDSQLQIGRLRRELERRQSDLERQNAELVESEQRALESEQRALDANQAKNEFLSHMSHELRTPLNAIIGFAQLLDREPTLLPEHKHTVSVIARSGEHLLNLINDILSVAKVEAGRATLNESELDVRRLLEGVQSMFHLRFRARGVEFEVEVAPSVPAYVRGDEGKLRQILINLVGNSYKFTDAGRVTLRAGWDDGRAAFEVEDTGPGVSEEEIAKIFEPFVQAETGRKANEGTGLGLAISRGFAVLMGGDISVRGRPGGGTTFRLDVPLAAVDGPDARTARRRVVGLEPNQPDYRLLVVDDKQENREVLTRLLCAVGFSPREASDGDEAIQVWREWRPDLIFMDLRMSVLDGYAATRAIRFAERLQGAGGRKPGTELREPDRCKILALTASAFEHDRDAILACGCDDFVMKPYAEATIFDKLAEHLGIGFVHEEEGGAAASAE